MLVTTAVLAAACSTASSVAGEAGSRLAPTATAAPPAGDAGTTTSTTSTTTTAPPRFPIADDGVAKVVVSPTGVVLPVLEETLEGTRVHTPCQREALAPAGSRAVRAVHVVIDPGHGGRPEPGSVGANGLVEAQLNDAVARELRAMLEAEGLRVALTREGDYELPIVTRAEIVNVLRPKLFVSIHHNGAEKVAARATPGSEVYFQFADPASKRLAGVVWEDLTAQLRTQPVAWVGLSDAGAIYRRSRDGSDFYGVLRRTAGTPAILVEAAYLGNPAEAEALATPEFQRIEARGIANGVVRWLTTDDAGSGYNTPIDRGFESSGGGTLNGCRDPKLA